MDCFPELVNYSYFKFAMHKPTVVAYELHPETDIIGNSARTTEYFSVEFRKKKLIYLF